MLVLCRKLWEKIAIGNDIVITVTDISGDKVRLGIDAPRHVAVNRLEVARRIARGAGGPTRYTDDDGEIEP